MDAISGGRKELDQRELEKRIAADYPGLRLLLIQRTRNEALAVDLLQDAVCVTLEKWRAGQIENPELVCGFVFQVAMNLWRNHRRSHGERGDLRASEAEVEQLAGAANPADAAAANAIAAQVKRFLKELGNVRDRLILKRFYLDEAEKPAICAELGLGADQFDRVLHRARARLRELMQSTGIRKTDLFSLVFA